MKLVVQIIEVGEQLLWLTANPKKNLKKTKQNPCFFFNKTKINFLNIFS